MEGFIFLLAAIVVFFIIHAMYCLSTVHRETITVRDKGIIVRGGGENSSAYSNHMVYTTNNQALKNTNCIWFKKWNSDELQAKLQVGKTYKIRTCGVRVQILGMHKNIINATLVNKRRQKTKRK